MDERLAAIFADVTANEIAIVAAAVLGVANARSQGIELVEIRKPHSDARTIGIVQVSGLAAVGTSVLRWSCVTKLIDLMVPNVLGTPVDPRNEVLVYERQYFAGAGLRLRPARCYHISRPNETLTILWLEDLTGASAPPFATSELSEMAGDLGEWNAVTAANPPQLDFPIGQDFQVRSWEGFNFTARARDLLANHRSDPMAREMYARYPLELAAEYVSVFGQLIKRSKTLPHGLSLADCPVSNFFHLPGETIAIDWAGLGSEPIGADGGRFIGSAMTWGRNFVTIIENERELFESYLGGLRAGGAKEDREVLRTGYLSEAAYYLCTMVTFPTMVSGPQAGLSTEFFEKRFDMPAAQFGSAMAPVIDFLPGYISEMRELLK